MDKGWIKLHRSLMDWEWWSEPLLVKAFLYLLFRAAVKDGIWRNIPYKRGEIVTSLRTLAKDLDVTYRQARTTLLKLKLTNNIVTKVYQKKTIITICNYDSYQSGVGSVRINKSHYIDTIEVTETAQYPSQYGNDIWQDDGSMMSQYPSQYGNDNGTKNVTKERSLNPFKSECYEDENEDNGTIDGTISAQDEAQNVAPIIRIKEYNNISRSSNIVQVQNLGDWLKYNSGQMWKEATAMNLGLKSLAELEPLFDVYQRECIAQGLDSQVEEKIKSHFVNLIRRKNDGKNKQQDAKSCATSSREQRMRDLKNFVAQNMGEGN